MLVGTGAAARATVYEFENLGTNFLNGGANTASTMVSVVNSSLSINETVTAGVFNSVLVSDPGTASEQTIATYSVCNDLFQKIDWYPNSGSHYVAQAVVYVTDPTTALSGSASLPSGVYMPNAANRSEVAYLMDTYLYGAAYQASTDSAFKVNSTTYGTARQRASALQAAIYDLWYGGGTATAADAGVQTIMSQLLSEAAGYTSYTSNTAVWVYSNQNASWYQDQLMVLSTPVPEPVFCQLTALAGLAVMGFRLRKRRA